MSQTRRLAGILAADVAGYSRLMGADEEGTLERLKALRRELVDPKIAEHHGRIVKTTGDGISMVRGAVTQVPHNSVACVMVLFMNNDDAGVRDRPSDSVGALDFDRRALDDLCRKFRVRRLDLFGSATTGHFDPARSDVDLLVEFEAMPPSAYAAAYFGLRAAAETLLGRPVDLVTEAALANPYLRRRIEGERRALFPQP